MSAQDPLPTQSPSDVDPRAAAARHKAWMKEFDPVQIGPYRILDRLGEGGMGIVYLAEQTHPIHRRVALKIVKLGMETKQVITRFEAEREALALMNHPNVARVIDAGATELGRPYFVMEHVPGIPITDYCDKHRLTTEERLRLFTDVCDAVQHAHQKGIIHRDIKPSNVLVTVQDEKPVVKVIDFGVAKAIQHRLTERTLFTEQGQMIGTPGYMSPEQAEMSALDIDTRTDVYSLGVLLYELLIGRLPFDTQTLLQAGFAEIQRIIREVDPPKPSTKLTNLGDDSTAVAHLRRTEIRTLTRELRGDLDWIVMKCLEKDRTRRYETASGLAAEIHRYLRQEPVLATAPTVGYRLRKFVRRNKMLVTSFLILVAVLSAGVVVSSMLFLRSETQRRRAVAAELQQSNERRRAEKALADAEAARDFAESAYGEAKSALRAMTDIANVFHVQGNLKETENTNRKILDIQRRILGENDPDTLRTTYNLACDMMHQDRLIESERLFLTCVDGLSRALGAEHELTLAAWHGFADMYCLQGRGDKAIEIHYRNLEILRRVFDLNHPKTALSFASLGDALMTLGRDSEAEATIREALRIRRNRLGSGNPETLYVKKELARVLNHMGRFDEAEDLLGNVIDDQNRTLGENHLHTLLSLHTLGHTYCGQNRLRDAEQLFRKTLGRCRSALGNNHRRTADWMMCLAEVLMDQNKLEEADMLLASAIEVRQKAVESANVTPQALNDLALATLLRSQKDTLRGAQAVVSWSERAVQETDGHNPFFLDTLAKAYFHAGAIDRAALFQQKALAQLDGERTLVRLKMAGRLAEYQVASGLWSQAEAVLLGIHQSLISMKYVPIAELKLCLARMVKLYELWHAADPEEGHDSHAASRRIELERLPSSQPAP